MRRLAREILRLGSFATVGAVAGAFDYAVMIGLRELLALQAPAAALAGYTVGSVVSYGLNRKGTFGSDRPHREATWRFAVVNVAGFAITGVMMHVLSDQMGVNYLAARLVTTALVFGLNYAAHRFWTFVEPVRRLEG